MRQETKEFIFPVIAGIVMALLVVFATKDNDIHATLCAVFASITTMLFSLLIQVGKLQDRIKDLEKR